MVKSKSTIIYKQNDAPQIEVILKECELSEKATTEYFSTFEFVGDSDKFE